MRQKNRFSLLVLLLLVCLVLVGTGTYAAYTNSSSEKAVAVAKANSSDFPFSSNLLFECEQAYPSYAEKPIRVVQGSQLSRTLMIFNYPKNDPANFSSTEITYTLTFALYDGDKKVTDSAITSILFVNNNPLSAQSSYSGSLKGGELSSTPYTISCAQENISLLSKYRLRITATPTGFTRMLAGNLVITSVSSQSIGWQWQYDDGSYKTVDGYNVKVYGTAAGTCTLTWDSDNFVISPWSLEDLEVISFSELGIVKFSVGQKDQPTSYRIQFYKLDGASSGTTPVTGFDFAPPDPLTAS